MALSCAQGALSRARSPSVLGPFLKRGFCACSVSYWAEETCMARRPSEDDIRRIYRDTMDDLYEFVSRRCDGDRELAEDVTQETWLRAVKSWSVDGVPDVPIAWLKTVASRLLINLRRRQAPDQLDEEAGGRVATTVDETVERRSLVARAMA